MAPASSTRGLLHPVRCVAGPVSRKCRTGCLDRRFNRLFAYGSTTFARFELTSNDSQIFAVFSSISAIRTSSADIHGLRYRDGSAHRDRRFAPVALLDFWPA